MLNSRRKFNRIDTNLFIEGRPLKGVASYFLGLTRNISSEGFSFTFQNFALEPGQRLQFKLRQPRTNIIISFLGEVIWQKQKDIKYSAGVKFCDSNKKNKKILLKIISDSCNIPVNSLLNRNDTGKLLSDELISRISNRNRSKLSWLYKTAIILTATATVLFLPSVIENLEDVSNKPIPESITVQLQTANNSNLIEVIEVKFPLAIKEKAPYIKLPVNTKDLTEENKYYIQVASLIDIDIAHGILSEIKQDYPSAYIFSHNNFHKVRIPDIKTSEQGYALLNIIETKFNMKPLLVKRVQ